MKTRLWRKNLAILAIFYPQNHPQIFGEMGLKCLFLHTNGSKSQIFKPLNLSQSSFSRKTNIFITSLSQP
jgi:hypothetical protein